MNQHRRHNNNRRFKNNNNQNRRYGGGNGQKFDDESNNISIQQRKNFANKREQYLQKAKDALSAGERVDAEGFYQHADHCYRMMNLGLVNARFDPQRMSIVSNNQPENPSENGDANPVDNNSNNSDANSSPQDISALPFMQNEAPSGESIERRIIE